MKPCDRVFQPEEELAGGSVICPACRAPCDPQPSGAIVVSPCCRYPLSTADANAPQHLHRGCEACVFLGRFGQADLWFCPAAGKWDRKFSAVTARTGPGDHQYMSAPYPLEMRVGSPAIQEAAARAAARGLL